MSKRNGSDTPRWRNTTKTLPAEGATVLCWWGDLTEPPAKDCYGVATYARPGHWHEPENDEDDYRDPDYWMDLPKRPEAK